MSSHAVLLIHIGLSISSRFVSLGSEPHNVLEEAAVALGRIRGGVVGIGDRGVRQRVLRRS